MSNNDEQVLQPEDFYSPTWARLKAHYEAKLARARLRNDLDLTQEQTIALRAQIKEIKKLLSLGEARDPAQVTDAA